jgi:tetratricopeptide (TPR) repeat protein
MGCGVPFLAPVLVAIAYERLARDQETDWDFAEDCLVTHGSAGSLSMATGVLGLAAMLWLYGVAWHQPMAESVEWVRTQVIDALPDQGLATAGEGKIGVLSTVLPAASRPPSEPATRTGGMVGTATPGAKDDDGVIDADVAALMAKRREKIAVLKAEGPRMLAAGNSRRAVELCREWADLDLGNPNAWRCLGQAQQAQGDYHDALAAFRRAKHYDPNDRSLDAAIDRAERGIIAEFIAKYRR